VIHAQCERAAKEKTPHVADYKTRQEREPVHACATPSKGEGAKKIIVKISESRVGLQEEIAVQHAKREDDRECSAEAMCPLHGWVGGEADEGHKRWEKK
jgi:hypothetical protein